MAQMKISSQICQDVPSQLVLYFRGVGLQIPCEINGAQDWNLFRLAQEHIMKPVIENDPKSPSKFMNLLVGLYDEIKEKFKDKVAMVNPRHLRKLWGIAYETKLNLWTNLVINFVKLNVIPNDDYNGFLFFPLEVNRLLSEISPEHLNRAGLCLSTKPVRDSCEHCEEIAEKKCSGCYKVYYCSSRCQREHWKTHKVACRNKK